MYVKVKLCSNDKQNEEPEIFKIRDNATVQELKEKLEVLFGNSLGMLNIRSIFRTLDNADGLSSILRLKKPNESATDIPGCAFSLLSGKKIVALLKFYSYAEADEVHKDSVNLPSKALLLPVDIQAPSDSNSSVSENSSISNKLEEKSANFNKVEKSICPLKLADKSVGQNTMLSGNQAGRSISIFRSKMHNMARYCKKEHNSDKEAEDDFDYDEEPNPMCKDKKRDCCVQNKCGKPDPRPPYARTMPENRQYGLVLSNDDPCEDVDMEKIMVQLFSIFENCEVQDLYFSDCTSTAKFCRNLLMVTEDDDTADWVIRAIEGVCPPHSCERFIDFFHLIHCTFVLPLIVPGKALCSIFDLLELQNCGLVTDKWTVVCRRTLDPCDPDYHSKAVSEICENEEFEMYIDEESRELIESQCSKLKYCFWRLKFVFDC
ncbi:uncharacterized protein LOC108047890 [Drosophila rhopaloa]|uniref:Uncharacterized protein LOC108047890 n=1 Tax=Drosophila rhopaloa TaxID=1041015 RepID=A0A6P4F455_DRORH|nr:uncharacterized protein LOC108047890 [Drosophila rhopaloa]